MIPSEAEPQPVVEARDLFFSYGSGRRGRRAEDGASFELRLTNLRVEKGARLAVHGPSGCGKSTLLDLLAGIHVPSRGRLRVAGVELGDLDDGRRRAHRLRHIGFVFQDFPLLDYLSVLDNVLLPFRLSRTLRLEGEARTRADDLLTRLGLGDKTGRRPARLSQGERQRVAVARALVTEPTLILADEPTAGLDPSGAGRVLTLLEELCAASGATLILVSHDPAVLERFETCLDLGEVVASLPDRGEPIG